MSEGGHDQVGAVLQPTKEGHLDVSEHIVDALRVQDATYDATQHAAKKEVDEKNGLDVHHGSNVYSDTGADASTDHLRDLEKLDGVEENVSEVRSIYMCFLLKVTELTRYVFFHRLTRQLICPH